MTKQNVVIFCALLVKLSNNERSYDPALLKPNAPTEVAVVMVGDGLGVGGGRIEKRYYTYFVSREMGPPMPLLLRLCQIIKYSNI